MKQGPFKMKGKSPMMKALIGKQNNLPEELKAKILASPATMKKESMATMKKESMAKMKKAPAKMKKESMTKMKKESSMKMMDKKSPAKRLVKVDGKLVKETPEMKEKRLANTSGARRRRQLELKNSLLKPEAKIKKEKENEKKLLKDYNNPKRKDPLANLTGPKKPKVNKEKTTVNLVEKNPKKIVKKDKVKKVVKKVVRKVVKKADPLTKNIMDTNQKGDGDLKATVKNKKSNKQISEREYRKNRKGGESKFQYMKRMKKKK